MQTPKPGAASTTPAPVSKTVQRLLAQIHAEAEAATLAALSAKDGIVALHEVDRQNASIRTYCGDGLAWFDRSGYELTMSRQRFRYTNGYLVQTDWRPGQWRVSETRVDGQGRSWESMLGYFVIDDFGSLVPVQGGAA
jgi:hypothetical protein